MPRYVFLCKSCKQEFTLVMHMEDLDKGGFKCPHCGSENVEQQVATFSAVTSKKS